MPSAGSASSGQMRTNSAVVVAVVAAARRFATPQRISDNAPAGRERKNRDDAADDNRR